MSELSKRTWHYIQKPQDFGVTCPLCESTNLAWSEYEKHIWCYACEKDLNNYHSMLDGPVPMNVATMLGVSFDIFNMTTGKVERYDIATNKYIEDNG